jgi:hypothetical protein
MMQLLQDALMRNHCNARSGIGVAVIYFSEIFDRISPFDKNSKLNFSKYTPDIVVFNLFLK